MAIRFYIIIFLLEHYSPNNYGLPLLPRDWNNILPLDCTSGSKSGYRRFHHIHISKINQKEQHKKHDGKYKGSYSTIMTAPFSFVRAFRIF